ncbi:MAG: tetratricopeptide repeat protein [Methanococcaceae archaeon]
MKLLRLSAILAIALFTSIANAQTEEIFYSAKLPQTDLSYAKTKLATLLCGYNNLEYPLTVSVLDNRIEMTFKGKKKTTLRESIYFSDLFGYPVRVTKSVATPVKVSLNADVNSFNYSIRLKKCTVFTYNYSSEHLVSDGSPAPGFTFADVYDKQNVPATEAIYKELADYLFYFQHLYAVQQYDSLFNAFKPLAAQYCALKEKPQISEEQRKFIVQANIFNEQKNYEKAIELYKKAIELDQTAFPAGYSNLALLSAQLSQYDEAIFYMKKYLLLEPDAVEARADQDKIYEWETLMQN